MHRFKDPRAALRTIHLLAPLLLLTLLAPQAARVGGWIADRDSFRYNNQTYWVIEAAFGATDPSSWRTYLDDGTRTYYMNMRTLAGSASFKNPTVSIVKNPNGTGNVTAMTLLIKAEGAQPSLGNAKEDGTLVYYYDGNTTNPPVIAVAGDIADDTCSNPPPGDVCKARDSSNLLVDAGLTASKRFDAVLALGDNEYNASATAPYFLNYERTWGRVQTITKPTPGNHDPCSGAAQGTEPFRRYDDYFGSAFAPKEPCYYAFDIGNWHIISLDSSRTDGQNPDEGCGGLNPPPPESGPGPDCKENSAQDDFLEQELQNQPDSKCVLVYWHHPLWTTVGTDGSLAIKPIWDTFFEMTVPKRPDIVLNGHRHNYQHFQPLNNNRQVDPNGVTEFIVGTGGRLLDPNSVDTNDQRLYQGKRGASRSRVLVNAHPKCDVRVVSTGECGRQPVSTPRATST